MSYNYEIFRTAKEKLTDIRERELALLEQRKQEIAEKIPEYAALKQEMISLMGACMNQMFAHGDHLAPLQKKIRENGEKRTKLLLDHGYTEDYLEPHYHCSSCKDTGYIQSKKCSCFLKLLKETAVERSNLNYILDQQNFEHFDLSLYSTKGKKGEHSPRDNMARILKNVTTFLDTFELPETKSLLFTGKAGVGKTYLSSCIAREILDRGHHVFYQTAGKLSEIMEEHKFYRREADGVLTAVYEDLFDCDLLIIDDLGTEFTNNFTLTAIYELINKRLLNHKRMIITTNLDLEDLKKTYTERLFSRFLGSFEIFEFIGEDLRTKQIMENVE